MDITNVKPSVMTSVDKPVPAEVAVKTESNEPPKAALGVSPNSGDLSKKVDPEWIEQLNKELATHETGVYFSLDDSTKSSVVKVIDKSTDELIRQYPTEDSLRVMKNIREYLTSINQKSVLDKEIFKGSLLNEII